MILVTGFEAFGEHATNPSAELASRLGNAPGRLAAILPVSYANAAERVHELAAIHRPRIWIVLGLCADARGLRLERTARNRDESPQPDNDGVVQCGTPIVASGPEGYASSLPLDALAARLAREHVAFEWSQDAGGFLCNHVFYRACHALASRRDAICGLIHVPPANVLELDRQHAVIDAWLASLA